MTRIHLMAGAPGALLLLLGASRQDPTPAAEELWVCPPCSPDCHDTRYPEPGKCNGCGMALVEASSIATVAVLVFADALHAGR